MERRRQRVACSQLRGEATGRACYSPALDQAFWETWRRSASLAAAVGSGKAHWTKWPSPSRVEGADWLLVLCRNVRPDQHPGACQHGSSVPAHSGDRRCLQPSVQAVMGKCQDLHRHGKPGRHRVSNIPHLCCQEEQGRAWAFAGSSEGAWAAWWTWWRRCGRWRCIALSTSKRPQGKSQDRGQRRRGAGRSMMSMEEGELQPSAPSSEPNVMKAGMEQPGPAAKPSGGERSLFPLPFFACPAKKFGCSRPVKQRRDRIRRAVENCNEAIFGLNWLSGHRGCIPDGILVDGLQQQVMARVDGLVQCQKPSGAIDRPEAALRSLLKGASPYDLGISNETLAPYQYDLVSVPQDIKGCPDLADVLDVHDRSFLEQDRELMLKSASEVERSKLVPYWDPVLKHNKRAYYRLVRRLQQIGYFTYTLDPKCKIGVFFVWKSSRTRLRMITDARSANRLFKEPPGVSLMTGEGLGRIEVACGETVFSDPDAIDALSIYIGLSDVRDCFHRMRVPQWLAKYFAWEPVPASLLGLEGTVLEGVTLGRHDMVWPCAGSLCQGFSWSLFFAQRANEHQASLTGPLRGAHLANDRGGPVVLNVGKVRTDDRYFYVYVDNLGVIGSDKEIVDLAMSELQDAFNGQGLELHGSEVTKDYVEALGCVLEGKEMRSRCNPRRLWRIHHGIRGLLRRGKCSGKVLEIIIGHCTFLGLICRPILSIFHAVYPFMRKHYTEVACLWKTVREELQAFMGVSFLLVQDWWRPWNRMVTSSDSSLVGYGVCKSWWPRQLVAEVGRIQERSRFKRCGRHSARESALTAAGFHLHNKAWTLMDEKTLLALADEGWEVSSEFPEVPSGSLKRHLWSPVFWGKWKHDENIGVLEARTVYKAVKRLCMTRYGHDIRHVHLCDNLGVVLSVERCRSKNFKILKVVRCIAAFCLARNVHLSVRWIPSELNVSDEPSRVHDIADSKLLVDLVRADDFESFSPQAPRAQTAHANTQTQAGCNTDNRSSTQACKAASEQKPATDSGIGDKTSREEDGGKNQGVDHKLPDRAPEGHQSDWFLSSKDRLRTGQHCQEKTAARGGGREEREIAFCESGQESNCSREWISWCSRPCPGSRCWRRQQCLPGPGSNTTSAGKSCRNWRRQRESASPLPKPWIRCLWSSSTRSSFRGRELTTATTFWLRWWTRDQNSVV